MQRQNRLTRNRQFSYVYHRGKSASCRDMSLLYVRSGQKRVGFSISKKVGCAVVRNRVKRRLRECVRARLPRMANGMYVFVVRPCAAQASYAALERDVDMLLLKLFPSPAKGAADKRSRA